ncbi:MAG: gluconate 2-dehydrogenase subunit 3 family protein [Cyclobacteriaceae bacterium]
MDRRTAMRQLAILTGGATLLPACDFSEESILAAYKQLNITASHKALIKKLTNTIFPGVNLIKAEEIQLEDFVLVMSNDCLNEDQQEAYVKGLKQFDGFCKDNFDKKFTDMGQIEAENAFRKSLEIESGNEKEEVEAIRHFLATTKRFAIQGYLNSEYFMTEIQPYELVPARFIGSKKIEVS